MTDDERAIRRAYMRNYIEMAIRPGHGASMHRTGYTLTILRKQEDGRWVRQRDLFVLVGI